MNDPALIMPSSASSPANLYKNIIHYIMEKYEAQGTLIIWMFEEEKAGSRL
jgi:hypothetical protein